MPEKKKNIWFYISGIVSAVMAGITYFGTVLAILLAVVVYSTGGINDILGQLPEDVEISVAFITFVTIILICVFAVVAIVNTICAKKCFDFAKLDKDELLNEKSKLITVIILQFIMGSVITGVLSLVGFLSVTETLTAPRVNSDSSVEQKLINAKNLFESGTITEEEYKKLREDILNKF